MDECETGLRGAEGEGAQMDEIMMDDRVAAMMQLQQVQQKQEQMELLESHPVTNADAEFRRGLEELVQDHLNTCMALASCSSSHEISRADNSSSDDDNEHIEDLQVVVDGSSGSAYAPASFQSLSSEQLQEELEVQDGAERDMSSHSQEHNLDENVHSPASGDSPGRRQSRIMQTWDSRAEEMITTLERQAREAELLALAGQHTVSMLDASFLQEAPTLRSESILERGHRRASSLVQLWRGIEEERNVSRATAPAGGTPPLESEVSRETQTDFSGRDAGTFGEGMSPPSETSRAQANELIDTHVESGSDWVDNEQQSENRTTAGSQASAIGEMDRERVRQIVQHWARQNVANDIEAGVRGSRDGLNPWLGQNERERVRHLVRAWVETSSQRSPSLQRPDMGDLPRGTVAVRSEAREIADVELGRQRQQASEMVVEVLMRIDRERQRELERLTELRTVSDFSQRNRLQYLLRGRFLRGAAAEDDQRTPSSASREIGQLQQQQAVSRLREAFRSRLETIVRSQANARSAELEPRTQRPAQERRRQDEAAHMAERPAQVTRNRQAVAPSQRVDLETTVHDLELRELLGRRSVTTILASDFRDRLDHLIRSLVHRQIHSPRPRPPDPENTTRAPIPSPPPPPPLPQPIFQNTPWPRRMQQRPRTLASAFIPSPPPPPPPPQPLWQNPLWPRRVQQRPRVLEWEAGQNALREDMSRLHQGFAEMRRTLEACMDMQYELQRSVRQEVAGALQRMYAGRDVPEEALDGSKWKSVEKGICCICCDKQINSLLYRCGHMCTCLDCANEMVSNSGTCPMCRAPILEVVRAFTTA
ncbi:hypothetical protein KC19_11G115600 [Ceratodon purpureus]|uniref:RING-type domain-containing protein n=1 Tax=Ceratodon purpureus TaxID=3225 RepID=A0A8T0GDF7_CERPU|nr:hypothetical protein KC19_11G115600 [Ceratodon purpureus]